MDAESGPIAPPEKPAETLSQAPHLQERLAGLDALDSISVLSGLMTELDFQRYCIRLDWAVRLVLSSSRGRKKPKRSLLTEILNKDFDDMGVNSLEDPIEDFFVEAVPTQRGDFLIFSGGWQNAASHTERVIDAFSELLDGDPKTAALSGYRGRVTNKGRPDHLLRHIRRVEYVRSRSSALCGRLQLSAPPSMVCGVVIVRAPQPMEQFQIENNDGRVIMLADISAIPWTRGW